MKRHSNENSKIQKTRNQIREIGPCDLVLGSFIYYRKYTIRKVFTKLFPDLIEICRAAG